MNATQQRLQDVFVQVFDDESLSITPTTTAQDIDEWDSLMHVTLMVAVEQSFGVRFTSAEVVQLKSVGDLIRLIDARRHR